MNEYSFIQLTHSSNVLCLLEKYRKVPNFFSSSTSFICSKAISEDMISSKYFYRFCFISFWGFWFYNFLSFKISKSSKIATNGNKLCPTELQAEYAHRPFTNVVPFDETKPMEGGTTVRYGRAWTILMVSTLVVTFIFCLPFLHTNID